MPQWSIQWKNKFGIKAKQEKKKEKVYIRIRTRVEWDVAPVNVSKKKHW